MSINSPCSIDSTIRMQWRLRRRRTKREPIPRFSLSLSSNSIPFQACRECTVFGWMPLFPRLLSTTFSFTREPHLRNTSFLSIMLVNREWLYNRSSSIIRSSPKEIQSSTKASLVMFTVENFDPTDHSSKCSSSLYHSRSFAISNCN